MADNKIIFAPSKKPHIDDNDPGLLRRLASGRRLTLEDLDKSGAVAFVGGRIVGKQMFLRIMAEMRQYKTIEKELGIDLDTLFKALKYGIFEKFDMLKPAVINRRSPKMISFTNRCLIEEYDDGSLHSSTCHSYFYFKDYGKKWALTGKELENE